MPRINFQQQLVALKDKLLAMAALSQQVHACAFGQASAALVEKGAVGCSASDIHGAIDALAAWLAGSNNEPANLRTALFLDAVSVPGRVVDGRDA